MGDTIRVKANDVAFGDIALVGNVDRETSIDRLVEPGPGRRQPAGLCRGKGLPTEAGVRVLGHPLQATYSDNIVGRISRGSGEPIDGDYDLHGKSKINTGGPLSTP